MKLKFKILAFLAFLITISPLTVKAAGNVAGSFSGPSTVYQGNTITVTLRIDSITGADNNTLFSFGGFLVFDANYLKFISSKSISSLTESINSKTFKIAYADYNMKNGIRGSGNLASFTFKAIKLGKTTISLKNAESTDKGSDLNTSVSSKSITITPPPSSNNNLSSLSTNKGNISFNKNTTKYNLSVGSDVTSIVINATAEDAKSKISGIGSKNLNFGNNTIKVTVTAENGSAKTYTINVNRKDNRSSNNNLSSLSVSDGKLEPKFNKSTTSYSMEVPFSVSSLNIKAVAEDSKSKVNISNNNLKAEATTNVSVTVTAENGSKKTYTIKVKRGKDPNKKLSTNNYLSSLTVNNGLLSPVFNKEKVNYIVYLPFEIDNIQVTGTVEDTVYGLLKVDGPEKLNVGVNTYKLSVTAEDESVRVYTVNVIRGRSLDNTSSNTFLKEITLTKGKLKGKFNKETYIYYYSKSKGFNVNAVAEDENSEVSIKYVEDIVIITVTDSGNNSSVYVLLPKENNLIVLIIVGILVFSIGTVTGIAITKIGKKGNKKALTKK